MDLYVSVTLGMAGGSGSNLGRPKPYSNDSSSATSSICPITILWVVLSTRPVSFCFFEKIRGKKKKNLVLHGI